MELVNNLTKTALALGYKERSRKTLFFSKHGTQKCKLTLTIDTHQNHRAGAPFLMVGLYVCPCRGLTIIWSLNTVFVIKFTSCTADQFLRMCNFSLSIKTH